MNNSRKIRRGITVLALAGAATAISAAPALAETSATHQDVTQARTAQLGGLGGGNLLNGLLGGLLGGKSGPLGGIL
ncbi:hypothetical protein [Amycolatopsis sacchari]|uniref:hypothetical protein n=1 Tax=Amycolatopsis sacchari TaxID=115433 RepID=UPI003D749C38